jgi:hypothetical protein
MRMSPWAPRTAPISGSATKTMAAASRVVLIHGYRSTRTPGNVRKPSCCSQVPGHRLRAAPIRPVQRAIVTGGACGIETKTARAAPTEEIVRVFERQHGTARA